MIHRKGPWEGYRRQVSPVVSFPPSFARISRETSGYEKGTRQRSDRVLGQTLGFFVLPITPCDAGWALVDAKRGGAKLWRRDQSGRSKCTVLQSDRQTKFSSLALGKISQESYVSAK